MEFIITAALLVFVIVWAFRVEMGIAQISKTVRRIEELLKAHNKEK